MINSGATYKETLATKTCSKAKTLLFGFIYWQLAIKLEFNKKLIGSLYIHSISVFISGYIRFFNYFKQHFLLLLNQNIRASLKKSACSYKTTETESVIYTVKPAKCQVCSFLDLLEE